MLARFTRSGSESHPSLKILDPPMVRTDATGSSVSAAAPTIADDDRHINQPGAAAPADEVFIEHRQRRHRRTRANQRAIVISAATHDDPASVKSTT